MIGYEARARITADVAGFVAAQRQGAQASGTLAAAVQALNTQLQRTNLLSAQAAANLRTFSQASQQAGQRQNQAAGSATTLAQAMNQGAQAYNAAQAGAQQAAMAMAANSAEQNRSTQATTRNTQAQTQNNQTQQMTQRSLTAMGRELARLRNEQERYQALLATGARLNRDQQESYNRISDRLGELTQRFIQLNPQQRQAVTQARELAQASRLATQGIQEQSAAQVRLNQVGALTNTQLQTMGREIAQLTAQRDRLEAAQRQGVVLSQQETQALGALQGRLRELSGIYNRLNVDQMQAVTTARQLAQVNQAVAQSSRAATQAVSEQERAAQGLNGSLWSLRSAVGDASSSMGQLWSVSQRTTQALWENYSAQEMAIAQISRVSQATVSELNDIVSSVRQMSTEIPIAFEELANIAMLGSQVGVANDALGVFTETVALFAATSEVSADETASMMARIMEMTNLNETRGQKSVQNLGSAIAYLGSNALATDREILKTVESIATMTTQVGFSAEATVGLGSAMASLVIRPEIARGASQRVFLQLGEAINTTGSEMETLVNVTGQSQEALSQMADSNFEQYFFTVMEALSGVAQEGGDLIPIIREMGIINTRDAEVVARLAANYGVLETSVRESATAFENGQYLYEESDRIFNNLTARVQLLSNTWSNFLFAAVEAIAPFLTRVVDATTNIIAMADAMGAAPILGWGALLLGVAGAVGLLASGIGMASQGVLAFVGLLNMWTTRSAATTAATTAAAASTRALATSSGLATAAGLAQASAMTAGTVSTTGFAAATAGATAALRAFALAHPVVMIGGLVTALGAAMVSWGAFGSEAERAEGRVMRANQANIQAAGGLKAFSDALQQDTQVWREGQVEMHRHIDALDASTSSYSSAAAEIQRYSAYRTFSAEEMRNADKEAADEARRLATAQEDAARGIATTSGTMDDASSAARGLGSANAEASAGASSLFESNERLADATRETTKAYDENILAVGVVTRDTAAAVVNNQLMESTSWETAGALDAMAAAGIDMGHALTMELQNAGDGADYLRGSAEAMYDGFGRMERGGYHLADALRFVTFGLADYRTESQIAMTDAWEMADTMDAVSLAIENAELSNQQLIPVLSDLAGELGYTTEELMTMDDAALEAAASADVLEEATTGIGLTVGELAEAMGSFIDPLALWTEGLQEMNNGLDEGDAAFTRFIGNGVNNFDQYLQGMYEMRDAQLEWSSNLLELSTTVPPQVIGDLAAMGMEGAGLVADLVDATDEQVDRWVDLWEQGGEQLLTDYAVIWESFRVQAFEGGDAGGLEFVNSLMGQVATGEISMEEAVNQMIDYAEENFENADPTMNFYADNTEAIDELTSTLREVRDAINGAERNGDMDIEPEVVTGPSFWDSIVTAWNTITNWWGSGPTLNAAPQVTSRIPKRKDGGWVQGPGGPRQDKVPMMASPNEFVVKASAARRNADLLQWINGDGDMSSRRSFVNEPGPENYMRSAPPASRVRNMPDYGQTASSGVRRQWGSEKIVMNINNYYPQAEPTSVTTNRALQHVAGLNGVL